MKAKNGYACARCRLVTLVFRGQRADTCRHCGSHEWDPQPRKVYLPSELDIAADDKAQSERLVKPDSTKNDGHSAICSASPSMGIPNAWCSCGAESNENKATR